MALDAGLGGGISYSPQRVTLDWWDEEERKRKESLGIAGAPKPAQADVPKPTRWDSVAQKPRDYFLQRAEQVRLFALDGVLSEPYVPAHAGNGAAMSAALRVGRAQ